MNNAVLNRKSAGGDALNSAPGGPISKSPNSKSQNPNSSMSSTGPQVNKGTFKAQSSANFSPDQLINKSSKELPQGVDTSKREVGNDK